ncbi:MAG: DUF1700 domain-containing protein [Bdellovibrionales bacterium]
MTKSAFMNELKESLKSRGVINTEDILRDYEEHFAHGLQSGKNEEEICSRLGSPKSLAMAYETKALLSDSEDKGTQLKWTFVLRALGRLLLLAPFAIIVMFIPGLLLFSYLLTGWSLVGVGAVLSLLLLGLGFTGGILSFSFWIFAALISASLAGVGVVVAAFLFMFVTTRALVRMVIDYIIWNLNFVLDKRKEA